MSGMLFGALGFATNCFKLELFYGTDFLFGSFFVMVAAGRFGLAAGVIAGGIASACTFLHWNHPWAIVVFTCEAIVVGWLYTRRGKDLIFANILFWFSVGMPLSWGLHRFMLNMTQEQASFIITKQAVNGIFNALLASSILLIIRIRSSQQGESAVAAPPLRSILFNVLLALLLIPVIVLIIAEIRINIAAEEANTVRRVQNIAESGRELVSLKIGNCIMDLNNLSRHMEGFGSMKPAALQRELEIAKDTNHDLKRIGLYNGKGVSIAFIPPMDGQGRSTIGLALSKEPRFRELHRDKPIVSDIIPSRLDPSVPTVLIASPVNGPNGITGHVAASLDLGLLHKFLADFAQQRGVMITILDGRHNVITSNVPSRETGTEFDPFRGRLLKPLQNGASFASPKPAPGESVLQSSMKSVYLAQVSLGAATNWAVLVETPVSQFFMIARHKGFNRFTVALLLVVLASIVSQLLSRTLSSQLIAVAELTTALPQKLIEKGRVGWPRAGFRELEILLGNFDQMADSLSDYLEKLNKVNETLEQRVAERTHSLEVSEQRFRNMAEEVRRLNEELEMIVLERTKERDFSTAELEGFCYAISHELRAPIARLQGFCQAMKEECDEEKDGFKMFYAERIDIASRQLRDVVDSILLLSRLSKTEIAIAEVNLSELAEQISNTFMVSELPRKLHFKIDQGVTANCDRQLLIICLENLIGNAVKYSSKAETPVIEFGRADYGGENAYFVRDNGAGFNMAFADKLFKPFLRLHKESEFAGTGIGLVTVARIVERHGGRIWAEGKEGEGATFWFTLGQQGTG